MSSQIPGKLYGRGTLGLPQPLEKVLKLAQGNPGTQQKPLRKPILHCLLATSPAFPPEVIFSQSKPMAKTVFIPSLVKVLFLSWAADNTNVTCLGGT